MSERKSKHTTRLIRVIVFCLRSRSRWNVHFATDENDFQIRQRDDAGSICITFGIDPGCRDMIVAYDSGSESAPTMSTKQHAHESQCARKAQCTRRALRGSSRQLPGYATSNLLRLAERTPTRKKLDNLRWLRYLSHALPLLDARCLALRKSCIRRLRFGNYMR